MIITLKGANFANSNIGTLDSYSIRFVGSGVTNSNTSVDRDSNTGYSTTITLGTGYELNGSITVTMGGTDITSTAVSGLTITIPTKVTGNVVITVPTKTTATGEEDGGDEGGDETITPTVITDLSTYTRTQGFVSSTGTWNNINDNYLHVVIPVSEGSTLSITGNPNASLYIAGLRSYSIPANGDTVDYSTATDWTNRITIGKNTTRNYNIPSDVKYLVFFIIQNGNDATPSSLTLKIGG